MFPFLTTPTDVSQKTAMSNQHHQKTGIRFFFNNTDVTSMSHTFYILHYVNQLNNIQIQISTLYIFVRF